MTEKINDHESDKNLVVTTTTKAEDFVMRKLIPILLILIISLSYVSCNGAPAVTVGGDGTQYTTAASTPYESPSETPVEEPTETLPQVEVGIPSHDDETLPLPVIGEERAVTVTDMGDCTELVTVSEVDADFFEEYSLMMRSAGYEKMLQNKVANDKNVAAVYLSATHVATLFYAEDLSELRISLDLREATGLDEYLLSEKKEAQKVCEPQLLFVGNNYPEDSQTNSLCVILRMSDGRFIIFDGGWSDSLAPKDQSATRIRKLIKEHAPDPDNITIAAWLVTHAHTDHIGAIEYYVDNYLSLGDVVIENILINIPSDDQLLQSYPNRLEELKGKMEKYRNMLKKAEATGTNVHKTHAGQILTFGDVTLEILFTWDLLAPEPLSAFNSLSIVSRLTVEGQTIMVTGDTQTVSNKRMEALYGEDMHADFYTVPHHGWGSNTDTFVATVKPLWVLWPCLNKKDQYLPELSFHSFLWSESSSLLAEPFIADFKTYVFPLPFDGKTYTVVDNTEIK